MRRPPSWLAAAALVALGRREAPGTQWILRVDVGVAAVEPRTGSVLWEAWDGSDLPAEAGAVLRGAALKLLAKPEPADAADLGPRFPVPLAPDRFVKYHYDSARNEVDLILARGSAESPGEGLARFSFRSGWASYALGPETLYVLTDGCVRAFGPRGETSGGAWRADWSFDLAGFPAEREGAVRTSSWTMRVDGDGLWVADDLRIRRFGPAGRLDFEHVIREPWTRHQDGFGASVTLGAGAVYFRHGAGVIAVDRRNSRELWRLPTFRSPFPSRVLEVEDLVLVQVGSDCPRTITDALAEGSGPRKRTPERLVAATSLLRSYGDGWPRLALRKSIAGARRTRPGADLGRAFTAAERLLESWPAKRDRQRLIDFSVDALLAPPASPGAQSPFPADRALTWTLLQELIYGRAQGSDGRQGTNYAFESRDENPLPLSEARRRALRRECRRTLAEGPAEERGLAAGVLLSDAIGWATVSESELAALFLSPDDSVWRWAGSSLARHGRRDELVELAGRRPEKEHLSVLYTLANHMPGTLSESEKRFWIACVKRTPASVAYLLDLTRPAELPREYREPIRAYLVATLPRALASPPGKPNETTQREYEVNAALRVLNRWQDPEDGAVIASYMRYPNPLVQQHAKALLEDRQRPAPPAESR